MHPYLKKKKKERKYPYLERRSLVHAANFLSSEVPCLKSTALVLLEFPSLTPPPAPCQKDIYLHTEDINIPTAPVWHNSCVVRVQNTNKVLFKYLIMPGPATCKEMEGSIFTVLQ
jgi:hypothetical protein